MITTRFSSILALGVSLAPLSAQQEQQADAPLTTNVEADSYAIAEQLYAQARSTQDAHARAQAMGRAADLFARFAEKFAQSELRGKAMYLQAICQAESGDAVSSNNTLERIATECKGEYAAAAAYKLANQEAERQMWTNAIKYYNITIARTNRTELSNDATYRRGRAELQAGKRKEAEDTFKALAAMEGIDSKILHASLLSEAQMMAEDGRYEPAYGLFSKLLEMKELDAKVKASATLQAARLASRLGNSDKSQKHYSALIRMPDMDKFAFEAQMERVLALYKNEKYKEIVDYALKPASVTVSDEKTARYAMIVGQSAMELKGVELKGASNYEVAAEWFGKVEYGHPETNLAADAGYRRLICIQQYEPASFQKDAAKYLETYAKPGSATCCLMYVNLVRLMYADRLMSSDKAEAAKQFDALDVKNLPDSVRAESMYKKAWAAVQVNPDADVPQALNDFIDTYSADKHFPDALALRGTQRARKGEIDKALKDFDTVIEEYSDKEVSLVCLQRAAKLCAGSEKPEFKDKMVSYYKSFISRYSAGVQKGMKIKTAALAEAQYNVACALAQKGAAKELEEAENYFKEARTNDKEHYGHRVDLNLVQLYYKMQEAAKLKQALIDLEKNNQDSYKGLYVAILRWCGYSCYQSRDYFFAAKFLADSLPREQSDAKVESWVWKFLARSYLEQGLYEKGLEPAEKYLAIETQPYRLAEGKRDYAQLLVGVGRGPEAAKVCEDAISLGIDGPIKSSLFIVLGDACYISGQYGEAAKYYGRTANVVSDKELKPLSLYKIVRALKRDGKEGEASQYEKMLKTEFPTWSAPVSVEKLMESQNRPAPDSAPAPAPQS